MIDFFFLKNVKILDKIATAGGIENRNNQTDAPKLTLINLKNGKPLPNASKLEKLISKVKYFKF